MTAQTFIQDFFPHCQVFCALFGELLRLSHSPTTRSILKSSQGNFNAADYNTYLRNSFLRF